MLSCLVLMVLVFFVAPTNALGQENVEAETAQNDTVNRLDPDFVTASICIADPTDWRDDMLGVLGHAFIRLQCPHFNLDFCFSYEGQSVNEDYLGFLKGNLKMGLFAEYTDEYIKSYRNWNRTVKEYTLNLPPEAELRLWEIMDKHLEDGIELPMDLTEHGCTQTIVEYVTQALDTTDIVYAEWPEEFRLTRYDMAVNALENYPWLHLMAKCMGMYGNFDEDCPNPEKIIIPRQIEEVWQNATVNGKPLLTFKGNLTEGVTPVVQRPWFTPTVAGVMLLTLVIFVIVIIFFVRKNRK